GMLAAFDASLLVAHHAKGTQAPDGVALPYRDDLPEVLRNLALVEAVGADGSADLEFPLDGRDTAAAARLLGDDAGPYVVVHPGASGAERRWAPECFAAVADALAARGYRVVITGGPAETALAEHVAGRMGSGALVVAGRTDLGTLGAIVAGASLVVAN